MCAANSFISEPLAIELLIVNRSRVLDLSRPDLMRRAGYKNIAKGLRRLDELLAGDLDKTGGLIRALPAALDVTPEVIEHAIEETRRRIAEAQEAARQAREAAWRAAFRPHAIILTERTVPQPIFVAASSASNGCWAWSCQAHAVTRSLRVPSKSCRLARWTLLGICSLRLRFHPTRYQHRKIAALETERRPHSVHGGNAPEPVDHGGCAQLGQRGLCT